MSKIIKEQKEILRKLGIEKLNPMQEEAKLAIPAVDEVILLSPTGTGKTLAFLLPIIAELDPKCDEVQAIILVPSRELAIQIWQVTKDMGTGYKTNAAYGGRPISKDKKELKHPPAILIGTPGRIADHLRRKTFAVDDVRILVLDEFDKSLEVGFEKEMMEIVEALPVLDKKILTSATNNTQIPDFVDVRKPTIIDYSDTKIAQLTVKTIISPSKDKLATLEKALCHLGNQPGIIFCNFKDSIQRVSDYLYDHGIQHGCFYGGMEQIEREEALVKFRNGTHQLLIATDLAARGIDVPEIKFIIHYHLPMRGAEFTHRNGRTARMNAEGTAYVLKWEKEVLPEFIESSMIEDIYDARIPAHSDWETVRISGGRRDKISKGDIVGLCFKQGGLEKDQLGIIELKQDCAYLAVKSEISDRLVAKIDGMRLKKAKLKAWLV